MHYILDELRGIIHEVANELVVHGVIYNDDVRFAVELTKNPRHGHFATNIAFVLAKTIRKDPMEIAELFANKLAQHRFFIKAESARPGFVNMFLTAEFLAKTVEYINIQGNEYGATDHGNNELLNIEFVSANPTGPMHIGHARGAVLGDVLANLFKKLGYQVTKEFYINDAGSQIVKLAHSVYVRYLELLGQDISQMEFAYPGLYVIDIAAVVLEQYGSALVDKIETERYEILSEIAVNKMMQFIKQDLLILGIHHDVFVSEKALRCEGRVERAINFLQQHNLVYKGTMEAPKGKAAEDWHPHEQLIFKSTLFGDSTDRSLQKADGEWTYFAADIAYHFYKYERGFRKMFVSVGKDHDGYAKRIKAAVSAISNNQVELKVVLYDIVRFFDNGVAVKMSKRSGQILRINDVVEEVGSDIARFNLVSIDSKQVLDFDFQRVKEQSKDNQLFYIQYAHARCCSVIAMIGKAFPGMLAANGKAFMLSSQEESGTICLLALWPNVIFTAAQKQEPHHICTYLYQVASAWHAAWHAGKKDGSLRFLIEDNQDLTNARLALVFAVKHLLCSGLNILGIEPLDSM